MKKTIDVSLAGLLFHLDEAAYIKLKKYLEAVRRNIAQNGEAEEVLHEVEARIAEIFLEKQASPQQVINEKEVDEVIGILGQPEDFDEETGVENKPQKVKKALFRDADRAMIGGVAAGLAHYIGIDITLMRLIFLILLFVTHGSFLFIYLLLWIIMPKAKTAVDKLRMKGAPTNLDNIVEQVASEEELKGKRFGQTIESTGSQLGNVLVKLIGILIVFTTGILLLALLFSAINIAAFPGMNLWIEHNHMTQFWPVPFQTFAWLSFIIIGFPVAFIFLLGFKLLMPHTKLSKNMLIISGVIWLLALVYFTTQIIQGWGLQHKTTKTVLYETKWYPKKDTIQIKYKQKPNRPINSIITEAIKYYYTVSPDSLVHLKVMAKNTGIHLKKGEKNILKQAYFTHIDSINNEIWSDKYLYWPLNKYLSKLRIAVYIAIPSQKTVKIDTVLAYKSIVGQINGPLLIKNEKEHLKCLKKMEKLQPDKIEISAEGIHLQINDRGIQIIVNDKEKKADIKIDDNGIRIQTTDEK